jgi:acetyltransferase
LFLTRSRVTADGIKSAIVISAGFREAGAGGTLLEEELKQISRNITSASRAELPRPYQHERSERHLCRRQAEGTIGFFSQSGAMGIAIMDWAVVNSVGFSKFISLGNKADLSEIDFIDYFMNDPDTSLILGYIEDVVDGRRFIEIAQKATKVKPIVLLKSGGTEAGARAASSHTGALAGSDVAFDAAFKQTGVMRAQGVQDLFNMALTFSEGKVPRGNRLLVITNAGGPGIIAVDFAERLGIQLPHMTKESIDAIAAKLPPNASIFNPIDVIGDATWERYADVLNEAAKDPNVDGILVILTPQAMTDTEKTAGAVITTAKSTEKPIIASFMGAKRVRAGINLLKAASIPNFSYPELAVKGFKWLSDYREWKDAALEEVSTSWYNFDSAHETITSILRSGVYQVGEEEAMQILTYYGFQFPKRALAKTSREAVQLASTIGFPVVMKISSPAILHKTDVGGVRVNVKTATEVEDAFLEITANARRIMPDAFIKGVMIYEMLKGGREVILGVTYDRTFGHMIMFGLGGIYVEVLKEVGFWIAGSASRRACHGERDQDRRSPARRARGTAGRHQRDRELYREPFVPRIRFPGDPGARCEPPRGDGERRRGPGCKIIFKK